MSSADVRADGGAQILAPLFAALGDPIRLALIERLSGSAALSIARLAGDAPISRQAMTKHLRVLERAGLVRGLRHGRESRFALVPDRVAEAGGYLDQVAREWEEALGRLKSFIEERP